MAEYFQEIETEKITVTDLIVVTTCDNMLPGDLIVVNDSLKSVRFGTGSSGQILVTDSGTTTNLKWDNINDVMSTAVSGSTGDILYHNGNTFVVLNPSSSGYILTTNSTTGGPTWNSLTNILGFNTSGQVIVSGPSGQVIIEGPGTPGQVLTISSSGIGRWQDPAAGNLIFSLQPGEVRPRSTERTFAHFTWDQTKYGASGINLSSGVMSLYAKVETNASAILKFEKICGTGPATLMPNLTINSATSGLTNSSGVICLTGLVNPTANSLYGLKSTLVSGGTGPNADCGPIHLYGMQLKYISS
jgi:hypothetical protein